MQYKGTVRGTMERGRKIYVDCDINGDVVALSFDKSDLRDCYEHVVYASARPVYMEIKKSGEITKVTIDGRVVMSPKTLGL